MTAATALLILGAAALDVLANLLLKRSDGFTRPAYFVGAVLTVLAAFSLIGLAVYYVVELIERLVIPWHVSQRPVDVTGI